MCGPEPTTLKRTSRGLPDVMEHVKKLCGDYFSLGISQAHLHTLRGEDIKPDELFEKIWDELN